MYTQICGRPGCEVKVQNIATYKASFEICYLALNEVRKLKVFLDKILRTIYGPKRDQSGT